MDLSYVKKLIKMVSDHDVDEVEIEEEGKKIRVVKAKERAVAFAPSVYAVPPPGMAYPSPPPAAPAASPAPAQAAPPAAPATNIHEIRSPIVGTFYRAPAPDAAAFVDVGSTIAPGTVLCIVEAMKLMNEIESDIAGKIVKVLVENGQPVEYDQVLFQVEKA
jgi:acetyl-CoA carboxylase biotin carboxyl carrier protein